MFFASLSSVSSKLKCVKKDEGCFENGVFYPNGASVPNDNVCLECCPEILYCGCRYGDKVYKIGEEIPNGNPCETCTCHSIDKEVFWGEIACSYTTCPLPPPGCEYGDSKPGECCPEISFCGCRIDGKMYEFGEEIIDDDPCETCVCEQGDEIIETQSLCRRIECPIQEPGCVYRDRYPDECCPELLYCGCKIDGKVYDIGEVIPSENPCEFCDCVLDGTYEATSICETMECRPPPPGCEDIQTPPDVCCLNYDEIGCKTDSAI
ncbi:CLUMA_CG009436, isoform A [Clunio marinus]|uniref:CLUMA_CG009436, isoform A n=1 Tax=Clunio marinus TaxID=568069 RepID=A0A1J1I8V0_9DIPT|nr:CLUMA_CG009436, isoform A [Clunio marinus]